MIEAQPRTHIFVPPPAPRRWTVRISGVDLDIELDEVMQNVQICVGSRVVIAGNEPLADTPMSYLLAAARFLCDPQAEREPALVHAGTVVLITITRLRRDALEAARTHADAVKALADFSYDEYAHARRLATWLLAEFFVLNDEDCRNLSSMGADDTLVELARRFEANAYELEALDPTITALIRRCGWPVDATMAYVQLLVSVKHDGLAALTYDARVETYRQIINAFLILPNQMEITDE